MVTVIYPHAGAPFGKSGDEFQRGGEKPSRGEKASEVGKLSADCEPTLSGRTAKANQGPGGWVSGGKFGKRKRLRAD